MIDQPHSIPPEGTSHDERIEVLEGLVKLLKLKLDVDAERFEERIITLETKVEALAKAGRGLSELVGETSGLIVDVVQKVDALRGCCTHHKTGGAPEDSCGGDKSVCDVCKEHPCECRYPQGFRRSQR